MLRKVYSKLTQSTEEEGRGGGKRGREEGLFIINRSSEI